jgi:lipase
VRATWTSPPYVTEDLIADLQDHLGSDFELLDFECDHMVPHAKPTEVAALARKLLKAH